jgi:hypothetical protein
MVMRDLKWSASEKKIARRAYEAAAESMLARVVADFKARAAAVATPSEMWAIEDHLRQQRWKIEEMLDYRYSQLPLVFARLIAEGHLDEAQLSGLSEEKLGDHSPFAIDERIVALKVDKLPGGARLQAHGRLGKGAARNAISYDSTLLALPAPATPAAVPVPLSRAFRGLYAVRKYYGIGHAEQIVFCFRSLCSFEP